VAVLEVGDTGNRMTGEPFGCSIGSPARTGPDSGGRRLRTRLALVAAIVAAHGGRVEPREAPGGGARFRTVLVRMDGNGNPGGEPRGAPGGRCNPTAGRYRPRTMKALHTTVLTALIAALALSVGACGSSTRAGGPAAGPSTTVTLPVEPTSSAPADPGVTPSAPVTLGPSGPVVPPGVEVVPAGQVDSSALPEYVQPRDVYSFDGGRSLQVFGMAADPCAGIAADLVDQSAEAVKIVLRPMMAPQGGTDVCTQVITAKPATVALAEPLGQRTVYLSEAR